MMTMEPWENMLKNVNIDLPADGKAAPPQEFIPKEIIRKRVKKTDTKVVVQRISTEIIVTTDMQGKVSTTNCFQSITPMGEMSKAQVSKVIQEIRDSRNSQT